MDIELDDERLQLREEDKTRQLVVPVQAATIDDLTEAADAVHSALPPPVVTPFVAVPSTQRSAPRAAPPAPRAKADTPVAGVAGSTSVSGTTPISGSTPLSSASPIDIATRTTNPSVAEVAPQPMPSMPKSPDTDRQPLPPLPNALRPAQSTVAEEAPARGDSAPTIVVKEIVNQPSPRRLQREATVVVRRAVRKTKRSPMAIAVLAAVGIVAVILGYVIVRRYVELRDHERRIEQRFDAIRRTSH